MCIRDRYLDELEAKDDIENQLAYNGTFDYTLKINSNRFSILILIEIFYTITVSYTHLDVYKRQLHMLISFLPENLSEKY